MSTRLLLRSGWCAAPSRREGRRQLQLSTSKGASKARALALQLLFDYDCYLFPNDIFGVCGLLGGPLLAPLPAGLPGGGVGRSAFFLSNESGVLSEETVTV